MVLCLVEFRDNAKMNVSAMTDTNGQAVEVQNGEPFAFTDNGRALVRR